jgi:hypothetical protein
MPLSPLEAINRINERGAFMDNRGVLHDDGGRIKRVWQLKRWIVCVLEFRGRKRTVLTPGHYTEFFFLDEATALSAGHRPCAECRHARFLDLCNAWGAAHPADGTSARPTSQEIDDCLHAERIAPDCSKRPFVAALDDLSDGVIVTVGSWGDQWAIHLTEARGCGGIVPSLYLYFAVPYT